MVTKKLLVLGSDGMAGHLIMDYLSVKNEYKLFEMKENCFLSSNFDYINKIISYNPDIIINGLRLTVQDSEEDPQKAIFINSLLPKLLEKYFFESTVRIIHLSTDCVFSGNKGNYTEHDLPDGDSIYSMTKACGEIINNKDLTIRASYIGPNINDNNEELFDWFLKQSGEIEGYKDAYWNGVTTLELVKQIDFAIKNNIHGLYHLCSKNIICKYELLSIIKKRWNKKDVIINKNFTYKIDRSLIDLRRELSNNNFKVMIDELYIYMEANKTLYDHYNN